MARRLAQFDFAREGRPKYPWQDWMDGKPWEVVKGSDFDCEAGSLVVYLYHKARAEGCQVRTQVVRGDDKKPDKIIFQFYQSERGYKRLKRKTKQLKRGPHATR